MRTPWQEDVSQPFSTGSEACSGIGFRLIVGDWDQGSLADCYVTERAPLIVETPNLRDT